MPAVPGSHSASAAGKTVQSEGAYLWACVSVSW